MHCNVVHEAPKRKLRKLAGAPTKSKAAAAAGL